MPFHPLRYAMGRHFSPLQKISISAQFSMVENLITLIRLSVGKKICSQLAQKCLKVGSVGRIIK